MTSPDAEQDIVGVFREDTCACISVLYVRGGAGTDDVSIEDATSEWMNSSAKMHAEYLALNALIKAGDDDETL